jgi:hypothetical protein
MEGNRPFSKRLLDALDGAIAAVEKSRWLRVLFSPESLTMTVAASASTAFRDRIRQALRHYVDAAKASGELREQLDPDAVADWLVRVAQMLLINHLAGGQHDARTEQAGDAAQLRHPGDPQPHRYRHRESAHPNEEHQAVVRSAQQAVDRQPPGRRSW